MLVGTCLLYVSLQAHLRRCNFSKLCAHCIAGTYASRTGFSEAADRASVHCVVGVHWVIGVQKSPQARHARIGSAAHSSSLRSKPLLSNQTPVVFSVARLAVIR